MTRSGSVVLTPPSPGHGQGGEKPVHRLVEEQRGGSDPGAVRGGHHREGDLLPALPSQHQEGGAFLFRERRLHRHPLGEEALGPAQHLGAVQRRDDLVDHAEAQWVEEGGRSERIAMPVGWPATGTLATTLRAARSMTSTAPGSLPTDSQEI
jgi:hypothetical protein